MLSLMKTPSNFAMTVSPSSQSGLRSRPKYMGYSQRVQQWPFGVDYRQSDQEIQHSASEAGYSDKVLWMCRRRARSKANELSPDEAV